MKRASLFLFGGLLAGNAWGAEPRAYQEITGSVVKLSDLFEDLGNSPDRALGAAPAPGERIVVEAPQLAAIARDFGVDWRPGSGAERVVIQRACTHLPLSAVLPVLRKALADLGVSADADLSVPGYTSPLLPAGAAQPAVDISGTIYDPATQRFSALLTVEAAGMAPVQARLSGQALAMEDATLILHHVKAGSVLTKDDVRSVRVRTGSLGGHVPATLALAIGMVVRHDLPEGHVLTEAELVRRVLVVRNATVRMELAAGGIVLGAQGIALEEGGAGDRIRVQNPSSNTIVIGEVTGPNEVTIVPPAAGAIQVAVQ